MVWKWMWILYWYKFGYKLGYDIDRNIDTDMDRYENKRWDISHIECHTKYHLKITKRRKDGG